MDLGTTGTADYYEPVVISATDYFPFGMDMPGRIYQAGDYRFGFNGKEKDQNEEWGDLTHYDYGFRIYNPGIARFLSVDPLTKSYPWYTPYQFAGNKPIVAIDLDGLEEVIIHSAFWTEKFLELDLTNMSYDQILAETNRINKKGYIDANAELHARKYYESEGQVATFNPAPEGVFSLTGFTNATTGEVIKFTIYSSVRGGGFIEISFPEIEDQKGLEGDLEGVQYIIALPAAKYSGFGKLGRALHNYMDGEDPWTGEQGSTGRLAISGVTDLLTMGTGPLGALSNQGLNMFQEALEQASPETLEEIGLGREALDIRLSTNKVELISNIIQAGLVTEELYNKHFGDANQNESEKEKR